jgi:hypothetical protein
MMAVDVSAGPNLTLSEPRVLFERKYAFQNATIANYDVSADGKRFVMVRDESGSAPLTMVINWFEELKRLVPTTK